MERKHEETEFEFCWRCICAKIENTIECDWQDIVDVFNLGIHRDSLRKAVNVGEFSAYSIAKYYKQKIEELLSQESNSDSGIQPLIDELKQQKIELQKERVKLADERRQYHSLIRTEARWEVLSERIQHAIENLPVLPRSSQLAEEGEHGAIASVLLSDWHIGSYINTYHNQFNTEIAQERVSKLEQDVIKYCRLHNVSKLYVNVMGDLISGNIHISTRLNNQENVVRQTMLCSELLATFIHNLSQYIKEVVVNFTIGNHGRVSANVKESLDEENFEYLILEFLKLRLQDTNVQFNEVKIDKEIVTYEVFNKTVACVHGHREKKVFDSVKELSYFLGKKIDLVCCGHFHNFATRNNVIINGALSGADEYANNLRFNNAPSQTLVIHFENESQALYEIILK